MQTRRELLVRSLLAPAVAGAAAAADPPREGERFDLLVYEATPGGIAMAVRAARGGLSVLLVDHSLHLGGILSNGLGVWDTLYEGFRAPIYDETRQAIFDHYREIYGPDSEQYRQALPGKTGHTNGKFEPKVAELVLARMVEAESGIRVVKGFCVTGVQRTGLKIDSVRFQEMGGSRSFQARAEVYADCGYEGDLMAASAVPYRVGREGRGRHGEPHAGRIFMRPHKEPPTEEAALTATKLARLNLRHFGDWQEILYPESSGAPDRNVQAFNLRAILSSDPQNRIMPPKPEDYDPEYLGSLDYGSRVRPIPNNKICWNRPQVLGAHQEYIEGDWETRQRVIAKHREVAWALLYYLQHDPAVPEKTRAEFRDFGLARDEFDDNEHWPGEIYVREARRLEGRAIVTEHDLNLAPGIERAPIQPDSIAVAEWYMDAHACTNEQLEGSLHEGKMMLHKETFPGQIPYRALLPRGVDNLLVPVCLSATHVAWGAVRLEPTWMSIGESAALAAIDAIRAKTPVASIDPNRLVRSVAEGRIMISFLNDVDLRAKQSWVPAVAWAATRGFLPTYDARPNDPLTKPVATAWARIAKRLAQGESSSDPASAARLVMAAERRGGPPVDSSDLPILIPGMETLAKPTRAAVLQGIYDATG